MKALIFGMQGQDGTYLAKLLHDNGVQPVLGVINYHGRHVEQLADVKPDYVFHLAAASTTNHDSARENHLAIAEGTFDLLENVRNLVPRCRVFMAGSALQYDDPPESVYACARDYARKLCRFYRARFGAHVYFGTLYHHESPLRKQRHISQIVAKAARNGEKLVIGDGRVLKEWTFAGDIAEAIWAMVNQDEVSECEICSGEGHTIWEWCQECYKVADLDHLDYVTATEGFKPDYSVMIGNPQAIRSIGWRPKVGFKELAEMMVKTCPRPS